MAETTTFSMFHRNGAAPPPSPVPEPVLEALSPLRALLQAEPPPPPAPTPPPPIPTPAPGAASAFAAEGTDIRASRREARRLLRQALGSEPPNPAVFSPAAPSPAAPSPLAPSPAAPEPSWPNGGSLLVPTPQEEVAEQVPLSPRPLDRPEAPAQDHAYALSLAMPYQLLGLADPFVCSLTSTVGAGAPIQLSAGRSGMYRPGRPPPAPPRFGYDAVPDTRTGLLAGSRVLTARGEVAVEHLAPGDAVLTLRGPALLPVTWIGHSAATEPPVEIAAGALGPDRPRQALRLAAGHPVFLDADPVAAGALVNGTTIRSLDLPGAALFHVGVGAAEVLLAEGVLLASAVR